MAARSSVLSYVCLIFLVASNTKISAQLTRRGIMANQTKYIGEKVSLLMYEDELTNKQGLMHYGRNAQLLKWTGHPWEDLLMDAWVTERVLSETNFVQAPYTTLYKTLWKGGKWVFRNAVSFLLTDLQKSDSGFYTVIVSNSKGHVYATMYLKVLDPRDIALAKAKEQARHEAKLSKKMQIMAIALAVMVVLAVSMVVGVLFFRQRAKNRRQNHLNTQVPTTLNIGPAPNTNAPLLFSEYEYTVVNPEQRTGMYLVIDHQEGEGEGEVEATPTPPPRPAAPVPIHTQPSTPSADSYYIW